MMKMKICQSCGMPLTNSDQYGKNKDGSVNEDYCHFCYDNGEFTMNVSMETFIDHCSKMATNANMSEEEMKAWCMQIFPTLKRWKK